MSSAASSIGRLSSCLLVCALSTPYLCLNSQLVFFCLGWRIGKGFGLHGPGLHLVVAWANPSKDGVLLVFSFLFLQLTWSLPTDKGACG